MPNKLQDFREQYPQYQDWSDDELAGALHERYYSDMEPDTFRAEVGLPAPPEPPREPGLWDRVTDLFSSKERTPANVLKDDPSLAEEFAEPAGVETVNRFNFNEYDEAGSLTPAGERMARQQKAQQRKAPGPRKLDVFSAGIDDYMANRADAAAFGYIEDYRAAGDIARGKRDQRDVGGYLGVTGKQISNFERNQRAKGGDTQAQAQIVGEMREAEERSIAALQEAIDDSALRREQAATVPYSPETEELLAAKGAGETLAEFADDPINIIMEVSLRSLPNMAEAIPLAVVGSIAGPVGFAGGLGLGSARVEYRASFSEYLRNHGVDLTDARSMFNAAKNDDLMRAAHGHAQTRSGIIGTVDALTGGLATKPMAPFVKNVLGRNLLDSALQTGVQMVGGMAGEAGAIAATEGVSALSERGGEIFVEGIAEAATAPIEVGGAAVTGMRAQAAQAEAARMESQAVAMLGDEVGVPDVPRETPAEPEPAPEAPGKPGLPWVQAGDTVDGLTVGQLNDEDAATLATEFDEVRMRGVQAVDLTEFAEDPADLLINKPARIAELADQITESGRIDPIVAVNMDPGLRVVEGAHRIEALRQLGKTQIPALVVDDISQAEELEPTPEPPTEPPLEAEPFPDPTTDAEARDMASAALEAGVDPSNVDDNREAIFKIPSEDWLADDEAVHQASIDRFRADAEANGWELVGEANNGKAFGYLVGGKRVELYKTGGGMGWSIQVNPPEKDWNKAVATRTGVAGEFIPAPEGEPATDADMAELYREDLQAAEAERTALANRLEKLMGEAQFHLDDNNQAGYAQTMEEVAGTEADIADLDADIAARRADLPPDIPGEVVAPAAPLPPPEPSPVEFIDPRLRRRDFVTHIQFMANELQYGGGGAGALIRGEAYPGEFEAEGRLTGEVEGRVPSSNPQWFQILNTDPDTRMSVRQVQNAVEKAVTGKKLGVRQARVVQAMLDEISGMRLSPGEMDYARQMLEESRQRRRAAQEAAGQPVGPDADTWGEVFTEDEYSPEMSAESRMIFELMDAAAAAGVTEATIERFAIQFEDNQELMQALQGAIDEQGRTTRAEAAPPEPGERPAADQAPAPARKRAKLTAIQQDALDKVTALGRPFTAREFLDLPAIAKPGAVSTAGGPTQPGNMSVNTLTGLVNKGYLREDDTRGGVFDGTYTVIPEAPPGVAAQAGPYNPAQLTMYLDAPPVSTQADAPNLAGAKTAAVDAIRNMRATNTNLGRKYSREFAAKQRINLVGHTLTSTADLAVAAQVYRDPRFETLRTLFLDKDNKVVGQLGLTARLPAAAAALIGTDMDAYLLEVGKQARKLGAVSLYMLHNHPSQQSMPSSADTSLTIKYATSLRTAPKDSRLKFLGHVVIDKNNWSEINAQGEVQRHEQELGAMDFTRRGGVAGTLIQGPRDVVGLLKHYQGNDPNAVVLIHVTQRHVVQSVTEIDSRDLKDRPEDNRKLLLRHALTEGGARIFAISRNRDALKSLGTLVVDGIWVQDNGQTESMAAMGELHFGGSLFDEWRNAKLSPDSSEAFDYLRPLAQAQMAVAPPWRAERFVQEEQKDLFGKNAEQQAIQDEIKRRDAKRNTGQDELETGDPADLFSEAQRQRDIEDQAESRRGQYKWNDTRGARVRKMSIEQLVDAVYTDALTGIGNLRAYQEEAGILPVKAVIDGDNLKWINNKLGLDAGDAMLVAIADAIDQDGVEAYRIGGDEFMLAGGSMEEVEAALVLAQGVLANQTITTDKGSVAGLGISYGIGRTKEEANAREELHKAARLKSGERVLSGQTPKGATLRPPRPMVMEEGTNYVPLIGKHGALPINAQNNLVLGNGRVVRIPKRPVRQQHVIAIMRKYFGNRIYEGRVKGKMRLGFYRPGQGEIRLKHHNDIEVAAHEVAHFLDDRYPWVKRLYMQHKAEMKGVSYDTKKIFEGYAEFMRLFFTQEWQAMKRAPGFYDAWTDALDEHQKLGRMVYDVQELMHAWTMQGARARGAGKMGQTPASIYEKMLRLFPVSWKQRALDGIRRIKEIEIELGNPDMQVAYEKLRIALGGSNGVIEAAMLFGTPGWRADGQGIELNGESLMDIFGNEWGDHDLGMYFLARRAKELASQGRENLMRPDEIAAWLTYEEENPRAAQMFDEYQMFNSRLLDFAEGGGILGADTRAAIEEMNKSYVPFHRVIESQLEGTRVRAGGNPFMRLKGGTQNVNVIWDNMVNGMGQIIRLAMLNDGKRAILSKLSGTGSRQPGAAALQAGTFAAPISADSRAVGISQDQVLKSVVEAMGWNMSQYRMAKQGFIQGDDDLALVEIVDAMARGLPNFVTFFELNVAPAGNVDYYQDGDRKVWFEIIDPALWDSLKFMGPKGTNLVYQVLGAFSATLRRGVVAVPVFQTKNFARDSMNAWMLSQNVRVPAARALRKVMSRFNTNPAYIEMLINGGGFANRIQGLNTQRKLVIDPTRATATYDRFMGRFENANRLAEFEAAIEAGESPRRAALLSREISTDFAMRGSSEVARFLAISVPFLNARAQGLYRVARVTDSKETAASFALRGTALAAATLALYGLNKDDERYEELPEDIKDLYWVFFTGDGEDDYFLIPKPFEAGMIWGTLPERMFELIEERDGKEFADAMLWMFLQTFSMDMTPQVFQPYIDIERNKTFTGAPIIPFGLENVEPSEQFSYYTGETARAAGQALGLSPIKLEHAFRGYLGTLGTYALAASDALIRATTDPYMDPISGEVTEAGQYGEAPTRGEGWRENIMVRAVADWAVAEGPPRRAKSVTDLYDLVREAEVATNTLARKLDRQAEDTEAFISDPANALLIRVNPALQKVRTEFSELRKLMEKIRVDRNMTGDEKRIELWNLTRQRNEVARKAVEAIQQAEKDIAAGEPIGATGTGASEAVGAAAAGSAATRASAQPGPQPAEAARLAQ